MPTTSFTLTEIGLRLGVTLLASVILGFERESHGRAAGVRTTLLVGIAAAISMILSEYLFMESSGNDAGWRPDPARLSAGILTGMGFLGAGAIIRQENVIRGVTTAAVLWFVTILGLTFGSGHFILGLAGFLIALVALFILPYLEGYIKNDWYASVKVVLQLDGPSEEDFKKHIEGFGIKVKEIDMEYDVLHRQKTINFSLKFKKDNIKKDNLFDLSQKVVHELVNHPGVCQVKWS